MNQMRRFGAWGAKPPRRYPYATPATALGVSDHIWTISELVEAALAATEPPPEPQGRQVGPFRVIDGGLS